MADLLTELIRVPFFMLDIVFCILASFSGLPSVAPLRDELSYRNSMVQLIIR